MIIGTPTPFDHPQVSLEPLATMRRCAQTATHVTGPPWPSRTARQVAASVRSQSPCHPKEPMVEGYSLVNVDKR